MTHATPQPKASHHGMTPAAWTGSMLALLGFVVGSIGMMMGPDWLVFGIGAALVVAGVVAGWGMSIAGLGEPRVPREERYVSSTELP